MAFAVNKIRRTVSQNKHRYTKHGFDLDLTYITDRILAIGFPAVGLETLYRNPRRQVQRYVETMHKGHYCIFNLCAEKDYLYNPEEFGGNVSFYPFPDHNPSSLQIVADFCTEASEFLDAHPQNVIVVHCKAGRGRTGFIISCQLVFLGVRPTAAEAILLFGWMRTRDGDAVHQPSQVRYVKYVQFCKAQTTFVTNFEEKGRVTDARARVHESCVPLDCVPLGVLTTGKSVQADESTFYVDDHGHVFANRSGLRPVQQTGLYADCSGTFTAVVPQQCEPDVPLLSSKRTDLIVDMYDKVNVRLVQSQVAIPSDRKLQKQMCENIPQLEQLNVESLLQQIGTSNNHGKLLRADDLEKFAQQVKSTLASHIARGKPGYLLYLDRLRRQISSKHVWILLGHLLETNLTHTQEALFFKNVGDTSSTGNESSSSNSATKAANNHTNNKISLDGAILQTINAALQNNEHSVLLRSVYVRRATDVAATASKYVRPNNSNVSNPGTSGFFAEANSTVTGAATTGVSSISSAAITKDSKDTMKDLREEKETYNPLLDSYSDGKHRSMLQSPAIIAYYQSMYGGKSKHEKSQLSAMQSYAAPLDTATVHEAILLGLGTQQGATALLGSLANTKAHNAATARRRPSLVLPVVPASPPRSRSLRDGANLHTILADGDSALHTLFQGDDSPNSFDNTLIPACSNLFQTVETLYQQSMASYFRNTLPGFTIAAAQGALDGDSVRYQYLCVPGTLPLVPVDMRVACPSTTPNPPSVEPYASPPGLPDDDDNFEEGLLLERSITPISALRSPNLCPIEESSSEEDEVVFLGDLPRGSVDLMLDRDLCRSPAGSIFRTSPLQRGVSVTLPEADLDASSSQRETEQTVQLYSPALHSQSPLFSRPPTATESASFRPSLRFIGKRDTATVESAPPILTEQKPEQYTYLRLDIYVDTTLVACSVLRGNYETGWVWAAPPVSSVLVAHVTSETHMIHPGKESTSSRFSAESPLNGPPCSLDSTLSSLLPPGTQVFDSMSKFEEEQKSIYFGSNNMIYPLKQASLKTKSVLQPPLADELAANHDYTTNGTHVQQVRASKLHVKELTGMPISGDVRVELRKLPSSVAEQYYNINTLTPSNDNNGKKKRSAQDKRKRDLFKHSKYHDEGDSDGIDSVSDSSSADEGQDSEEENQDSIVDESVDGVHYSNQVILHGGSDEGVIGGSSGGGFENVSAKLLRLQERLSQARDMIGESIPLDMTPRPSAFPSPYGTPMSLYAPSHLPSFAEANLDEPTYDTSSNLQSQFERAGGVPSVVSTGDIKRNVLQGSNLDNSANSTTNGSFQQKRLHYVVSPRATTHRSTSPHTQRFAEDSSFAAINLLALDVSSDSDDDDVFIPSVDQSKLTTPGSALWLLGCTCALSFLTLQQPQVVFHTLHLPQVEYPHTSGMQTQLLNRESGDLTEIINPVSTVALTQAVDMIRLYERSILDRTQYVYVASDVKMDATFASEQGMVQRSKHGSETTFTMQPFTGPVSADIVFTVLSCWSKRFQLLDSLALTGAEPKNVHAVCIQHTLLDFSTSEMRRNDMGRFCDCSVSTITREYGAVHLANCSSVFYYRGWPTWFLQSCLDVFTAHAIPLQTLPCSCLTCNVCDRIVNECMCVCDFCQFSFDLCLCGSYTLSSNISPTQKTIPSALLANTTTHNVVAKERAGKATVSTDNQAPQDSVSSNIGNTMPYHIPTCPRCGSLTSQCICQTPIPKSFLTHGKLVGRCSFNTNMLPGPVLELRFEDIVDSRSIHSLKPSKAAFFKEDLVLGLEFALAPTNNPTTELIVNVPNENSSDADKSLKYHSTKINAEQTVVTLPLSMTSIYSAPYTVAECLKYDYMLDEYYPSCPFRYMPAMAYVVSVAQTAAHMRKAISLCMIPVPRLIKNHAHVDFFFLFHALASKLTRITCSSLTHQVSTMGQAALPQPWLEELLPGVHSQLFNKYILQSAESTPSIEDQTPSSFLLYLACTTTYLHVISAGDTDCNTSITQFLQRTLSFYLQTAWKFILQSHFGLTMESILSVHVNVLEEGRLEVIWNGVVESIDSAEWHGVKPCECVQELRAIVDCAQQTLRIEEISTNGFCVTHRVQEPATAPVATAPYSPALSNINDDASRSSIPNVLMLTEGTLSIPRRNKILPSTINAPLIHAKMPPRSRPPSAPSFNVTQSLQLDADQVSNVDSSPSLAPSNVSSAGQLSPVPFHTRNRSVFGFESGFGRPLVTPHSHYSGSSIDDGTKRTFSYFTFETGSSDNAKNGNTFLLSSPRNEVQLSPLSTTSRRSSHTARSSTSICSDFEGYPGDLYISADLGRRSGENRSYDESQELGEPPVSSQMLKKRVNLEYSSQIADAPCNVHNITSCSCSACTVVTSLARVSASLLSTETMYSRSLNFCLAYVCQPLYMKCIQAGFKTDWLAKRNTLPAFYNLCKSFYSKFTRIERRKNVLYKVLQSYQQTTNAQYYKTPTKHPGRLRGFDNDVDLHGLSAVASSAGDEDYDILSPLPQPRFEMSGYGDTLSTVPSFIGDASPALTLNNSNKLSISPNDGGAPPHSSVLKILTQVFTRMLSHWPQSGRPVLSPLTQSLEQFCPRATAAQPAGEKRTVTRGRTDFFPPVPRPLLLHHDPFPLTPYSTIAAMLINVLPAITALQSRMGILMSCALTSSFATSNSERIARLDEIEPYTMVYSRYLADGVTTEPPPCAYDLSTCCACYPYLMQPIPTAKHQRWYKCLCTTQPSKHHLLCPHEFMLLTKVNGLGPAGIALIIHSYARNLNFLLSKYVRCVEVVGKIIPKLSGPGSSGHRFQKNIRENRAKLRKRKDSYNMSYLVSTSGIATDSGLQVTTNATLRTSSILGSVLGCVTVTNNKNNITENTKKLTHNLLSCCNLGFSSSVLQSISRTLHYVQDSPNHRSLLTFYLAPLARFVALEESLNQYAALYTTQADALIENQALFMDYYDQAAEETTGVCQMIRKSFATIDQHNMQLSESTEDEPNACICELKPTKLCKRCFVAHGYTRGVTRANLVRQLCLSAANLLRIAVASKEFSLAEVGPIKSRQLHWEHALLPAKAIDAIMAGAKRAPKMSIIDVQQHQYRVTDAQTKTLQTPELLSRLAENCLFQAETMIFFAFRQHKIGKNTIRLFLFDPVSHFFFIVKLKPRPDLPENTVLPDLHAFINDNLRHIHNEYQECMKHRDERYLSAVDLLETYKVRMQEFVTTLQKNYVFAEHTFVGSGKCAISQIHLKPLQIHVELDIRAPVVTPDHTVSDVQWLVQGTQSQHDLLHYSRYISHISAQLYENGETTLHRTFVIPYFGDLFKRVMNNLEY